LTLCVGLPALAQDTTNSNGPTLNAILARREVICGVNQDLFGFGYLDPNTGEVSGFDVDFCRAVAAAVLGDAKLVSLPLYSGVADGENALLNGDVDLLMHNVTWTMTDDAKGLIFGPVNFYSGQTAMVRTLRNATTWADLDGATICVVTGSIAESDVLPYMASQGLHGGLLSVATLIDGQQALNEGRCDAISSDVAQLSILRQRSGDPQSYMIWQNSSLFYTREPYAPVLRPGDDQWQTIVEWTFLGLIEAEQLGISSENVQSWIRQTTPATQDGQPSTTESDADYLNRVGPEVARFLDPTLGIGKNLGIASNFMLPVIREVGNYGEIYNRHLGSEGDLPIERGLNNLWTKGGLLYAPNWR